MPNVIQIRDKEGNALYPITDSSLVIGLKDGGIMENVMAWDGTSAPTVANIPAGVQVEYNSTTYTGTLAASGTTSGYIYLVASATQQGEYDRYIVNAAGGSYTWVALSSTQIVSPTIADNLTTNDATKALSAKQGKVLNDELSQLGQEVTPMSQLYKANQAVASGGTIDGSMSGVNGNFESSSTNYHNVYYRLEAGKTYSISFSILRNISVSVATFYTGESLPTRGTLGQILTTGVSGTYNQTFTPQASGYLLILDTVNTLSYTDSRVIKTTGYIDFQGEIDALDVRMGNAEKGVLETKEAGAFYMGGYVNYSTGVIYSSSGGEKLYIIYRNRIPADATKIFARICTQNSTFAAVAFFSDIVPDESNYIAASSVQGVSSSDPSLFEVSLPAQWESALVLNMSQLYATPLIYLDVHNSLNPEFVDASVNGALTQVERAKSLFNLFAGRPFYHHLNQENSPTQQTIPAQSLLDITYAKRLGASLIEASIHKCSDDVYVVKHGNAGALGEGIKSVGGQDYSATLFSAVTSTWLRENITYDCNRAKYDVYIPTFDEFCAKCKQEALAVKLAYNSDGLAIARKYLPDDMIFMTASERPAGFRGTVEYVYDPTNQTLSQCLAACALIGAPLQIVVLAGKVQSMSESAVKDLVISAHNAGYIVGLVYTSLAETIQYLGWGVDAICSSFKQINLFDEGNALNIESLNDAKIVLSGGASYDSTTDTITMPQGGKITVSPDNPFVLGKMCVNIRFSGTISVKHGGIVYTYYNLSGYQSDGGKMISYALALNPFSSADISEWIEITADVATTIQELKIAASIL